MKLIVGAVLLLVVTAVALLMIFVSTRLFTFGRAIGRGLRRGLVQLLHAVAALTVSALIGGLVGVAAAAIASSGSSDPTLTGLAVGGITTLGLLLMYSWRQRGHKLQLRETRFDDVPPKTVKVMPDPIEGQTLSVAWTQAEKLLPSGSASRLAQARLASRTILRRAEAQPDDLAAIEGATLVTRHVPLLVQEAVTLCEGGNPSDRTRHQAALLSGLEMLGARGAAYEDEGRAEVEKRFEQRLAHIQARSLGDPFSRTMK